MKTRGVGCVLALFWMLAASASAQAPDLVALPESGGFQDSSAAAGCSDTYPARRYQSFFQAAEGTGADARGRVTIAYFHDVDGDGRWSAGDIEVARGTTDPFFLPPGRIADFATMGPASVPTPSLTLWQFVDADDDIAELDETNNFAPLGLPCSVGSAPDVPLADLVVSIVDVDVRTAGLPPNEGVATAVARVFNVGGVDPAAVVSLVIQCSTHGPAPPSCDPLSPRIESVPAPPPGGWTDFPFEVQFTWDAHVDVVVDSLPLPSPPTHPHGDPGPPGVVPECVEWNNACSRVIDVGLSVRGSAPPIGGSLRSAGHSSSPTHVMAMYEWEEDEGAPRAPEDSFVVLMSTNPRRLDPVLIDPPLREPRWTLALPRSSGERMIHYVLVAAADAEGRLSE